MVRGWRGWRSSMVERLICNQQVAGSSPIASSRGDIFQSGEVPKWPKGADCKSAGAAFGGSNPPLSTICPQEAGIAQWPEHQPSKLRVAGSSPVSRSSSRAHVAQLVEHFLGKEEVHRFDPGRGLHFCQGAGKPEKLQAKPAWLICPGIKGGERSITAATNDRSHPVVPGRAGICLLERRDGQEEV